MIDNLRKPAATLANIRAAEYIRRSAEARRAFKREYRNRKQENKP